MSNQPNYADASIALNDSRLFPFDEGRLLPSILRIVLTKAQKIPIQHRELVEEALAIISPLQSGELLLQIVDTRFTFIPFLLPFVLKKDAEVKIALTDTIEMSSDIRRSLFVDDLKAWVDRNCVLYKSTFERSKKEAKPSRFVSIIPPNDERAVLLAINYLRSTGRGKILMPDGGRKKVKVLLDRFREMNIWVQPRAAGYLVAEI